MTPAVPVAPASLVVPTTDLTIPAKPVLLATRGTGIQTRYVWWRRFSNHGVPAAGTGQCSKISEALGLRPGIYHVEGRLSRPAALAYSSILSTTLTGSGMPFSSLSRDSSHSISPGT